MRDILIMFGVLRIVIKSLTKKQKRIGIYSTSQNFLRY